jgi:aldose 1-epimerase
MIFYTLQKVGQLIMGYSILHIEENGLKIVLLNDDKSGTRAAVLPQMGALLHGFSVQLADGPINVVDHYSSWKEAEEKIDKTFKSARLSPFTCRVAEGKYIFKGREYQFNKKFTDGSAIHGLLYNKPFQIISSAADMDSASLTMQYDYKKDDPGYPFQYRSEITYTLSAENLLEIRTRISNLSDGPIPIADGWHPYFILGGQLDDWLMHFNAEALVRFDDKLIPTGELETFDEFKEPRRIGPAFLDNCFLLDISSGLPACELFNPENKIKISFYPESSYPYLQIYTPEGRRSIAIENMSAAPDCFNNNMGLLLLEPGNSQSFTVFYQLTIV